MKLYHHQEISEQSSVIIMQMEFKFLVRKWDPRLNVSNCFIAKFTDSRWHLCRIPQKFALTLVVRFCICFPQALVASDEEWGWSAADSPSDNNMITLHAPHIKIICQIIPEFPTCEVDYKMVRIWPGQERVYVRSEIATQELRSALCSAINFNGWCWSHGRT